ncbi:hypothetical protein IVA82_24515 [Bradyrhizobium sp. 142]|nr:hypothetical protein [Bradyrhizobium sp. 142]MCK1728251.1 hypothetical protein [Bradyrhizobium sp. 142]
MTILVGMASSRLLRSRSFHCTLAISPLLIPVAGSSSGKQVNHTDMTFTIRNGAVLRFKSAENQDNLYEEDVWACAMVAASKASAVA